MKKPLLLLIAMFCLAFTMQAQRTLSGVVTDASTGETLIGANVFVPGTGVGTITDIDGNFSFEVDDDVTSIEVSYTGFATRIIELGANNYFEIALSEGEILDEVVVIGYGTVRKEDATGSVNVITDEDFNRGALTAPDQLISGKIAGVQVTSNGGAPGASAEIRIRGGTSVNASNEPLYVIDGIPIDNAGGLGGRNKLNFLNMNDVENITVLKDASATAIYGSRGANGVIIITTKKGEAGSTPKLSYSGYYTTSSVGSEFGNLSRDAFTNVVTFVAPERLGSLGTANTDWSNEVLRTAKGQSHNLSFTGGGENSGYRLSVGYQSIEGVIGTTKNENANFSLNFFQKFLNDDLILNVNLKNGLVKDALDPGVVETAYRFDPTQPVLDADNTDFGGYFEYGLSLAPRNPVSNIEQVKRDGKSFRSLGNIELEYKFTNWVPGLSAKVNLGADIANGEFVGFQPTTYLNKRVSDRDGEIRLEKFNRTNTLLDAYMIYNTELGSNHNLTLTGGYSYQDFDYDEQKNVGFDLSTDIFGPNSFAAAGEFENQNDVRVNRLISFFGRANLNLSDKYLFTFTLRRDGSTRFGPANRWGTFPSAAFAWRISEEDFAAGLSNTFSNLKLRLGYGVTGNQEIGDFKYLPLYRSSDNQTQYQFGDEFVSTFRPNPYDAGLKWEETSSLNVGLDFGILDGRINGSLEYYNKKTKDLLFIVDVPAGTNLSDRVLTNIGELTNNGVELTLDSRILRKNKINWDLGLNLAYNTNEVTAIDEISGETGVLTGGISGGVGNNVQILQVGQAVNSFFLFQQKYDDMGNPLVDGVDHNEDGVINLADMYENLHIDLDEFGNPAPDDQQVVNDLDKRAYKKPAPDLIIGISSQFSVGNFDLGFALRGNIGNYVYDNTASNLGNFNHMTLNPNYTNNLHESVLVTNFDDPQFFTDYYISDASFLRMDNLTLGYNVPTNDNKSIRIYGTVQNLFVLTNYNGLDPEFANGIDNSPYPRPRTILFGVTLGL